MWDYVKLVAHYSWVLLASGVLAIVAALNAVFDNMPVFSAIVSPWFWACVAAVGLIVAQALAARRLMRRGGGTGGPPVIQNYHYHAPVHHHHGPVDRETDSQS